MQREKMALCTSQFNERVGPNVLNVLGPPLNCGYKILQKPRVNTFVITQNPVLSGPNNACFYYMEDYKYEESQYWTDWKCSKLLSPVQTYWSMLPVFLLSPSGVYSSNCF